MCNKFESIEQARINDGRENYIDFRPIKPDSYRAPISVEIKALPSLRVFVEYFQASKYVTVALHHLELALPKIDEKFHVFDDDIKRAGLKNILTIMPRHSRVCPLTAKQAYYDHSLNTHPSIQMGLLHGLNPANGVEIADCSVQSLDIYLTVAEDTGACYTRNAMNKLAEIDTKQYSVITKRPFHRVQYKGDSGCVADPMLMETHVNSDIIV